MPRRKGGSIRQPLLQLFRSPKVETLFVAVPGVGTKPPIEWTDEAGNIWLTGIKAPGIGLFSYEHDLNKSDPNLWQNLLDHGQSLFMSLITLVENQHLHHCPILIVGHSLGGFIVKEMLRLAYERTELKYRPLKKALSGAILMGTPHSIKAADEDKWQRVALLPYVAERTLKTQALHKEDIQKLIQSSLEFDQQGILCPILTVAETRATKSKQVWNPKRTMLVDSDFAKTGCIGEEIIEVDSNHRNLPNVSNDSKMLKFIAIALEDARLKIASDSPLSMEVDELDETGYDMGETSTNPTSGPDSTPDPFTASNTAGSSDLGFDVVPLTSNLKLADEGLKLPCYPIPVARNKDFYGRQDVIDKINEFYFESATTKEEEDNSAKSFALCGPGGMGKTQIVTEYVHRCKNDGTFDAIFWIYADKPSKLADGVSQIAISLGLVPSDSNDALDPVITANLTKGWLTNPVRGVPDENQVEKPPSWLIVLDNVDDISVLEGFWPFEGPGCVLITSRDPLAKESHVLADTGYDLKSFTTEESSSMLKQLTKRKEDGREIGDRLGGLPLALAQMASVIIRNHMTFEEFVETWDENQEHPEYLGFKGALGHPDGYDKNLSTAWAIESLRHGKALLEVMSFLDPDSIQEQILKAYTSASLECYPGSNIAYLKARKELLQTSLIARDSTEKNLTVHRMVQDATRSKLDGKQYQAAFSAALRLVSKAWPFEAFGWRHGVARWRKCEELFPHVLRLKQFGMELLPKLDSIDIKISYCKLMNDAGWYYHETGHFIESQSFIEQAQSVAESTQAELARGGITQTSKAEIAKELVAILAETHHNLGCIGTESNQPEFTLKHFKKFNEMMSTEVTEELQKTDSRLAISWNELGNAYMMNKMWKEGENCFKICLEVAQRMSNFAPAEFSFPYVNLGLAYWLTDRQDLARATLEEGLQHRVAAFGHDDSQSFITGRFLFALGNVAASQGRLEESFGYHERALRQFLSTIGKNHHRTGDIHVKVAEHKLRLGQISEASTHIDEAIKIFSERVIFKPELARAEFLQSDILQASGDNTRARHLRSKSVKSYYQMSRKAAVSGSEPSRADFDDLIAFWSR